MKQLLGIHTSAQSVFFSLLLNLVQLPELKPLKSLITVLIMLLIQATTLRLLWNFGDIIVSIDNKDGKNRSDISS